MIPDTWFFVAVAIVIAAGMGDLVSPAGAATRPREQKRAARGGRDA
jgi:hypothetical protein